MKGMGILLADDLAVIYFISYVCQKRIKLGDKYCKNWKLKCNLNKSKVVVFNKGGKLKAAERWRMNGQNLKVGDKFNYLGVTLESTGVWIKEKTLAKTKEYQAVGELVCNAKVMCGIEMLGLSEAWKKSYTVHS